jgi:hypothetical protein
VRNEIARLLPGPRDDELGGHFAQPGRQFRQQAALQ